MSRYNSYNYHTLFKLFFAIIFVRESISVSNSSFAALKSLFISTNGNNWVWNPSSPSSTHWNFSKLDPSQPCLNSWQGITCDSDDIIVLDLSSFNLVGQLPSDIDGLKNLKNLYLESNTISGSIPSSLGNLTNLENISFKSNKLTGSIPAPLCNIVSHLSSMDVSDNELNCYSECLSGYVTYTLSVVTPILVDNSVIQCGSSFRPSVSPTKSSNSSVDTASFGGLSVTSLIIIVVLGSFLLGGLAVLFLTRYLLVPPLLARYNSEKEVSHPSLKHFKMDEWLSKFGPENARKKSVDTTQDELTNYWISGVDSGELTVIPDQEGSQSRSSSIGSRPHSMNASHLLMTNNSAKQFNRTSIRVSPMRPPLPEFRSLEKQDEENPVMVTEETTGIVLTAYRPTKSVAPKGHRIRMLPNLESQQIDLIPPNAEPYLGELRFIGNCIWAKVPMELIPPASIQNCRGFDISLHGWTLIKKKDVVFWEPVTTT